MSFFEELLAVTSKRCDRLIDTNKYTVKCLAFVPATGYDDWEDMTPWADHYAGFDRDWDNTSANHGLGTRQGNHARELITFY